MTYSNFHQTEVKVDQIWSDDIEVTEVTSGENIKTKVCQALVFTAHFRSRTLVFQVKGIEESDVTPGFVLCCPANPIKTGKVFDAQVSIRGLVKHFSPILD